MPRPGLGEPVQVGANGVEKRLSAARRFVSWDAKQVLDIGCGNGAYTEVLAQDASRTVGIDVERGWLTDFNARCGFQQLAWAAAEHLPLRDDTFDLAFAIETLEHVTDERLTLGELRRVLKPGGQVVLTVPNKWYLFETHGLKSGPIRGNRIPLLSWLPPPIHSRIADARIYTTGGLRRLLAEAGFAEIQLDYVMPPLDKVGARRLRILLRWLTAHLERGWFTRFGVSIVACARRPA